MNQFLRDSIRILTFGCIVLGTVAFILHYTTKHKCKEPLLFPIQIDEDFKKNPPKIWNEQNFEIMNTRNYVTDKLNGIAKYMDVVIKNPKNIFYNKSLDECKSVYLNSDSSNSLQENVINFIDNILPKIKNTIVFIIGGVDATFPNQIDKRFNQNPPHIVQKFKNLPNHPNIKKIFVENLDESMTNTYPIPLGISIDELTIPNESPCLFYYFQPLQNLNKDKPLLITNFNRSRDGKDQWNERGIVNNFCNNQWKDFISPTEHLPHIEYLKYMAKYSFTICIHGGGLDVNPKLWEALLVGVIPIIKRNEPYTSLYKDWPVVIVNEWNESSITQKKLRRWHKKYIPYFTNSKKRKKLLYKLSLDYWIKVILGK